MDKYQKIEKIGEGTYGVVYKSKDKETNTIVALKKLRLECEEEGVPANGLREISILKEFPHPNIVKLLHVVAEHGQVYLSFEYAHDGDLKKYMDYNSGKMEDATIRSFMKQLLEAIVFLHHHRIIHRDLKPQNLLLFTDGTLKVGDFGLARFFTVPGHTLTHEIVTLWYRAPEVLLGQRVYDTGVDMWSIGCIFFELLSKGMPLFPGDSEIDQIFKIFQALGTPTEESWPSLSSLPDYKATFPNWKTPTLDKRFEDAKITASEQAKDLLQRFLTLDPKKRISAKDALNHPYFAVIEVPTPVGEVSKNALVDETLLVNVQITIENDRVHVCIKPIVSGS